MAGDFGIFLQGLLNDFAISPPELARLMGRTERTVYYWLRGRRVPRDAVALLSDALEIPIAHLRPAAAGERAIPPAYLDRARLGPRGHALRLLRQGSRQLLTRSAAANASGEQAGPAIVADIDLAGSGLNYDAANYDAPNYDTAAQRREETIPAFESVAAGPLGVCDVRQLSGSLGDSGRFKVRVRGASMSPDYPDGCWVVFSRPRAMAEGVVDDKDYLVWTTAEQSTFKRLARDPADPWQYLLLRPLNPDRGQYPQLRVHRGEIAYIARAVRKEIDVA